MTNARALYLVTKREIVTRAKSGAYIVSTVFTVGLLLAAILLPTLLSGPTEYTVGLVGSGNEAIVATAVEVANAGNDADADPDDVTTIDTVVFDDVASADEALADDEIDAVLVDAEDVVIRSASGAGGDDLSGLLQRAASTLEVDALVAETGTDADVVSILEGEPLELRTLEGVASEENAARTLIAYGGLMLMYIAILSYGAWTLTGVTEEKTNRVVEVLLATLRPWQLLAGKVIGIGALGLAQFVVTIAIALTAIRITGAFDLPALPLDTTAMLVVWFVLGFTIYSILYAAAGSLVSRVEDAQTSSTPLTVFALVSFFLSFVALDDPTGIVAVVGTYVPLTAPFVVPIRFALQSVSGLTIAISVVITVATTIGLIRLAGQVYAGGLLRFGGRVKWREAFRSAEI